MKIAWLFLLACAHGMVIIDSDVASACIYYMKQFDWGCGGTGQGAKLYTCRCANVDWLGSVSSCIFSYGENSATVNHAYAHTATRCLQKGDFHYSVSDFSEWKKNASSYLKYPTTSDIANQVFHPLSVNETDFAVYIRSFRQMNHHVFKSQWLGWGLIFYWAAIITVCTVANAVWKFFRINVFGKTLLQIYHKHLRQEIGVFGLDRLNAIIMVFSLIQIVLSTALSYEVELPNVYIGELYFLTLDLLGYRSALLAFSLMPVCYIFGLRNNPFTWMTGLPQTQFITWHKFTAIVFSVEALIHSAVWTAYALRDGGYAMWGMDDYWRWGVVGTILVFLMLGQSIRFVRVLMYETFLIVHKIFGWLFIVSMYYHCNALGWMGWVYALIGCVAYDRTIRLVKIFFVNRGYQKIKVSVVDSKVMKITIPKPLLFDATYAPGNYLYMSFYHWPIWYQCWQSHPFSIISSPVESADHLTAYVRVKRGSTEILSTLNTDEKGNVYMWALLEGPYGERADTFSRTDAVVGITGGIGICGLLPTFYSIIGPSRLYWAINNLNELEILRGDLDYLMSRGCDVQVVYRASHSEEDSLIEKVEPCLSVTLERPDVGEWVGEAVKFAHQQDASELTIVSCGPGSMTKQIKSSVASFTTVGQALAIRHILENGEW